MFANKRKRHMFIMWNLGIDYTKIFSYMREIFD